MRSSLLVALFVTLGGCTFPTVVPEATSTEYKPTGEVQAYSQNATFDDVRVRGVRVNLAKRTDGSWGGTVADRAVDVSVDEGHIRGVDFVVSREETVGSHNVITGQFQGRIFRFEWDENQALIRTGQKSLTYPGRVVSERATKYGPRAEFELRGDAGLERAPWPQIAFALIGAFY
jgi:hypothetical protein